MGARSDVTLGCGNLGARTVPSRRDSDLGGWLTRDLRPGLMNSARRAMHRNNIGFGAFQRGIRGLPACRTIRAPAKDTGPKGPEFFASGRGPERAALPRNCIVSSADALGTGCGPIRPGPNSRGGCSHSILILLSGIVQPSTSAHSKSPASRAHFAREMGHPFASDSLLL